jgi:hypothetical protein
MRFATLAFVTVVEVDSETVRTSGVGRQGRALAVRTGRSAADMAGRSGSSGPAIN